MNLIDLSAIDEKYKSDALTSKTGAYDILDIINKVKEKYAHA